MVAAFLQETLRRFNAFGGALDEWAAPEPAPACVSTMEQAAELVVDATSSRLRAIPGYSRRLRGPIVTALRCIDEMVDRIPGVLHCRRETFSTDPHVNAFFVGPTDLQQVFSLSKEVRDLFDANAQADQCFALLCMHREERRQIGMAVQGDVVRRDVMQTSVSFTDHELVSPGLVEQDARAALKCSIFTSLLGHIRIRSIGARQRDAELRARAGALRARLARRHRASIDRGAFESELREIEAELDAPRPRLESLEDQFRFVLDMLESPQDIIRCCQHSIYVDHFGVKHGGPEAANARELAISEVHVLGRRPRVACLVSFPREQLLPKRDFLQEASVFLAS
jgi:hypothetical protein